MHGVHLNGPYLGMWRFEGLILSRECRLELPHGILLERFYLRLRCEAFLPVPDSTLSYFYYFNLLERDGFHLLIGG
jgi:hypothetical protein